MNRWKLYNPNPLRSIDETPIDMMGFKIYRTHTEIRGRTFLRVRRSFRRARKELTLRISKKCLSYMLYRGKLRPERMICINPAST